MQDRLTRLVEGPWDRLRVQAFWKCGWLLLAIQGSQGFSAAERVLLPMMERRIRRALIGDHLPRSRRHGEDPRFRRLGPSAFAGQRASRPGRGRSSRRQKAGAHPSRLSQSSGRLGAWLIVADGLGSARGKNPRLTAVRCGSAVLTHRFATCVGRVRRRIRHRSTTGIESRFVEGCQASSLAAQELLDQCGPLDQVQLPARVAPETRHIFGPQRSATKILPRTLVHVFLFVYALFPLEFIWSGSTQSDTCMWGVSASAASFEFP